VGDAIDSVLAELNSTVGEQVVVRLHTDVGKEFANKATDELLRELDAYPTTTGGYYPKAIGRAERYIGWMKQKATPQWIHAKLPLQFRDRAVQHAAHIYRASAPQAAFAEDAPTFEHRAVIRSQGGGHEVRRQDMRRTLPLLGHRRRIRTKAVANTRIKLSVAH